MVSTEEKKKPPKWRKVAGLYTNQSQYEEGEKYLSGSAGKDDKYVSQALADITEAYKRTDTLRFMVVKNKYKETEYHPDWLLKVYVPEDEGTDLAAIPTPSLDKARQEDDVPF